MKIYRPILQKSWEIIRRYKFLWFFGLFAALLGNGGEVEIIYSNLSRFSDESENLSFIKDLFSSGRLESLFGQYSEYFSTDTPITIINLVLMILIFLLLIWLIIISQSAIINKVNRGEKGQEVNFNDSFQVGRRFFKPVFLINLFTRLFIYVLFAVICGPLLYLYLKGSELASGYLLAYLILSFIIFIPIGIVVSFISKYATAYAVIKEMKAWPAIKEGWSLFARNWLVSVEMSIILFAINLAAGIAFLIAFVLVCVPFLLLAMVFNSVAGQAGLTIITAFAYIVFFAGLFLVGATYSVFQFSSWTLLFLKFTEGSVLSKIARVLTPTKNK